MNNKKIGVNAFINGVKTVLSLIFPLITTPYIYRVLKVENVGKYNFSYSVISYFYLLSALGIATYAIREGAKCRDNRTKFSEFASHIFTINIFSTIISFFLLAIVLWNVNSLENYKNIILMLSINMIFTTIGCEWIFSVYEEYLYLAIRGIIFQVISLGLMFFLVTNQNDVLKYAFIVVVASSGSGLINFINVRKYANIKIIINRELITHLTPILILFAHAIATTIYVSSDTTILGFISGDYHVGIYSAATKIYIVIKNVLASVMIVSVPQLSMFWGNGETEKFKSLADNILNVLVLMVFPTITGIFIVSKEIILLISGKNFLAAERPLRILSITLVFCLIGWFYSACVLIPCKREKQMLIVTIISALVNIVLNIIMIPIFQENAAAMTTLISETLSFVMCWYVSKDIVSISLSKHNIITVIIGCVMLGGYCKVIDINLSGIVVKLLLQVTGSVIIYGVVLFVTKNPCLSELQKMILRKKNN